MMCVVYMFYNHDHKTAYMLSERTAQSYRFFIGSFIFGTVHESHRWPKAAATLKTKSYNLPEKKFGLRTQKKAFGIAIKKNAKMKKTYLLWLNLFIRLASGIARLYCFFNHLIWLHFFYHLNERSSMGKKNIVMLNSKMEMMFEKKKKQQRQPTKWQHTQGETKTYTPFKDIIWMERQREKNRLL